jgi:tRNA-dihydrouridine synthase A
VVEGLVPYIENELAAGNYLSRITRHTLGLFRGQPGGKAWRRHLSENAHRPGADAGVVLAALARVPDRVLDERPQPDASPAA